MRTTAIAATLALASPAIGQKTAEWQADLDHLVGRIEALHADYTRCIDPAELDRAASALRARIPRLSAARIGLELARIVAMLRDGHSGIRLVDDRDGAALLLPFSARTFDDGYRVIAAPAPHESLTGCRVVAIAGHEIDDVFERMAPYFSADNDGHLRSKLDSYVRFVKFLHPLGLVDDPAAVVVRVAGPDGPRDVRLAPRRLDEMRRWGRKNRIRSPLRVPIRGAARNYRFELLDRGRTLFVRHVVCGDDPKQKTVDFVRELRAFVDAHDFDRFVYDLRDNGGGSANYTVPFVRLIESHPKINREGRLFTLVGPRTYSAAMLCCGMLENRTKTLFVGRRTGQGVNLFGDAENGTLPASGLGYHISARWWQCTIAEDRRLWLEPDIAVPHRYEDWRAGRDPELEAVLAWTPAPKATRPLAAGEAARYAGRFRFSSWQELTVAVRDGALHFRIRDLIDGPAWLAEVASSLHPTAAAFATDMTGVSVRRAAGEGPVAEIVFDWRGTEIRCARLPAGYRFPIELADGGNIGTRPLGPEFLRGPNDAPRGIDPAAVPAALAAVVADRADYWDRTLLRERLNVAGYRFLRTGRPEVAVRFFRANVEMFPRWWNCHDSLGEALAELGEVEQAIAAYERSLELEPGNDNGRRRLARLRRRKR